MEEVQKNELITLEETLPVEQTDEYTKMFKTAVSFYEKHEFENASNVFKQIIEKFPDKAEAYVNYADALFEQLKTEEAVKYWAIAKEKNPFLINPYLNLGNYYLSKEELSKAKSEYETAFCLDPYNENLIVNLGMTHEKIGNRKMAFLLYEFFVANSVNISSTMYRAVHKKLTTHKLNAISHMKLGVFFERKHFYRKALQSFFESLRVFPNFSKTYINIGNIFFRFEKYDFAYLYWLEAYKFEKKKPKLCLNLALCCEKLDRKIDAYCYYTYFIQVTEANSEVIAARKKAMKLKSELTLNAEAIKLYKEEAESFAEKKEYETAIVMFENIYFLTRDNDYFKKKNDLLSATNIINKAAKTSLDYAKRCIDDKKCDKAIIKAKLAKQLWDNTEIAVAANEIISIAQVELNKSLDELVKARLKEEEEKEKQKYL